MSDIWEREIYGQGKHFNRYPYDQVVSFVFRNAPRDRPRADVRIVEVGCGAANNLWFAAREGYTVAGVDGSESAIAYARKRFADEGLSGDLRVADLTALPFDDAAFDLAIDRAAITCCPRQAALRAVAEVRRVLRPGGRFFFNVYADDHASARSGKPGPDGLTVDIVAGTVAGVGGLRFYDRAAVDELFVDGWKVLSRQQLRVSDESPALGVHSEWRVVAEKL